MKAYTPNNKKYKTTNTSTRFANRVDIKNIESEHKAPNLIAKRNEVIGYGNSSSAAIMLDFFKTSGVTEVIANYDETIRLADIKPQTSKKVAMSGEDFKFGHPYFGLSDARGNLSRYTTDKFYSTPLSREWVERYLNAGGSFDMHGVYGLHPFAGTENETHWAERCNPEHVARHLDLFGRLDGHTWEAEGDNFAESFTLMLSPYDDFNPQTRGEWHRIKRGELRKAQLLNWDLTTNEREKIELKSVLSFGWMSYDKFTDWAINNISSNHCEKRGCMLEFRGVCICGNSYYDSNNWIDSELKYFGKNERAILLRKQYAKYIERKKYVDHDRDWSRDATTVFGNELLLRQSENQKFNDIRNKHSVGFNSTRTSAGFIYYHNTRVFVRGVGEIKTKRKGDVTFFCLARELYNGGFDPSIETIWFAFKGNFAEHVEAETLREAIIQLESRNEKGGLKFSLNDVRNDKKGTASFCLAGTKDFLSKKMPFVYSLIKQYTRWAEIPKEIMCETYSLADQSIFNGYPHP